MLLDDYNIFSMEFKVLKTGITGRLALTCEDDVLIDIGGFDGLELCDKDYFDELCSANSPDELCTGNIIEIDGVEVEILDMDTETIEESILAYELMEMRELSYFD